MTYYSSSPLNPHHTQRRSSSPLSSPTPGHATLPLSIPPLPAKPGRTPPSRQQGSSPLSARYLTTRSTSSRNGLSTPTSSRRRPAPTRPTFNSSPSLIGDLFSEGTTPTQSAMWRDKLARRMADRERRQLARQDDLAKRRGIDGHRDQDEDEAERQARADDEEIFRRLMVLQRRREEHAALVSYELETGGSDPVLPEFWAEELDEMDCEERTLCQHLEASAYDEPPTRSPVSAFVTPTRNGAPVQSRIQSHDYDNLSTVNEETEEEQWAREAAEAEEEEMFALAMRIEEEQLRGSASFCPPQTQPCDIDMAPQHRPLHTTDWVDPNFLTDAMDVE